MNCSACGRENREGASFCTFCGAGLVSRCSSCGTDLHAEARFCDACGTPVAIEPEAKPVAAARKVVTVLFADMTGSTSLEEGMDAESVRALLDRFYAALRAEVDKRGGRVVKFTGDGVMAAFGVPDVHEDDAVRALGAATAMCAAVEQLATESNVPSLSLKVGINTGEVVVLEDDDDVVGDIVNVAARLENAAQAGEVLVGEGTWRLTRATSSYEPTEPLVLKGKSEPVPAYRLLSLDEAVESVSTPFVGRQAEIDKLLAVFDDAVATNSARLVTIIGSPGLGKTRLAQECLATLSERARVRETRCDPAGSTTFAPIADALRGAASIPDTADEGAIVAALEALIPEDDPDRSRIAMRAASVLGAGQAGSTEETFWAIRRLIEIAAGVRPVVFVLDDLHWAEPLLLDLVEHLAEWIRTAPVLLIGTGRPELRDLRPSFAEGGRAAAVIALEGLDGDETARLALGLLGTDRAPRELLARIPSSTEGNPLFVRELVRMLVDDGVLRRDGDEWNVTVDVDAIEVPPTIQSLLAARMDRLRPDERAVVELASVVGKEFYRGAVYELAPASVRGQIDSCLESLRRKELVEPVGTYWVDEPVFRFHHALIRDAAYRRLLKEVRVDLHERVAAWLEEKTEGIVGEHEEAVGYHLEQAHEYLRQLGRLDERAVEIGRRAASLLSTAASRALDHDDVPAAATLSGRALDCLPVDDDARAELLLVRCEALLSMGDVTHGAPAVAEFERIASTPRLAAWAACFAGQLAGFTDPERLQETEARVATAASELAALGDNAGAAKAHTVHASTLAKRGRFAECEAVLDDALMAARAAKDRRRITATLGMLPHAQLWGPNPVSRAGGRCLDVVRLLRITTGSPAVEATSRRCQAVLEAFRGRTDAARGMLRSAERKLTELGLHHELLEAEQFAGIIELIAGDAPAAETHLRASYEGLRKTGADVLAAQSAALLARAHLLMDEDDEADALVRTSEELAGLDLKAAIDGRTVKAELLARRGQLEEARRVAESAVALAEQTDGLFDHGNACRSLAAVCRAMGDASAARSADDRADALYERKGATALVESTGAEPVAPVVPAPQPGGPPPNRAASVAMPGTDFSLVTAEDIAALYADDAVWTDKRSGLGTRLVGREIVDNFLAVRDTGAARTEASLVATRGERLALLRSRLTGGVDESAFEVIVLGVCEVDDSDRIATMSIYDPDDIDAAIAELDERYAAGEGAIDSEAVRTWSAYARAYSARDWGTMRTLVTADFVFVDRRPVSLGRLEGPDALVQATKGLSEVFATWTIYCCTIYAFAPGVGLFDLRAVGTSADSSPIEYEALGVHQFRDGQISYSEYFPVDQLAAARARFDELGPQRSDTRLENACVRAVLRAGEALGQRDWDGLAAHMAEDLVGEDLRPTLAHRWEGRTETVERWKALAEMLEFEVEREIVAVRGDRLALFRQRFSSRAAADFEVIVLDLNEIDENGLICGVTLFEPDDLENAFVKLDERFIEGEGGNAADVVEVWGAYTRAYDEGDWDAQRGLIAEDAVMVDHRPASLGTIRGIDALVAPPKARVELLSEWHAYSAAVHELSPGAGLFELHVVGVTKESGAAVDFPVLALVQIVDGRVFRVEGFPVEALDAARERFAAVVGYDVNLAARVTRQLREAALDDDFEAARTLITDDSVSYDMRHGVRLSVHGADARVDEMRSALEVGVTRIDTTIVATRGERLVLERSIWGGSVQGSFELEILHIAEIDEHGRLAASYRYDPGELDAALAQLDERFVAGEGAPHAAIVRYWQAFCRALNERDWTGLRALVTDDLAVLDHRPASLGEMLGAEAWIDSIKELVRLVPFHSHVVAYHGLEEDRYLAHQLNKGTTADGADIEIPFVHLGHMRNGRMDRWEFFRPEDLDAAFARYDELFTSAEVADNASMRALRRVIAEVVAGQWGLLAKVIAEDCFVEDRRRALGNAVAGRAQVLEFAKSLGEAFGSRDYTCIATRGERLALARGAWKSTVTDARFDAEVLSVTATNDAGLLAAQIFFDPDDLDSAFAELDDRYMLGEGAPYASTLRLATESAAHHPARDWEKYRETLADDLVFIDHRPASLGEIHGADEWVAATRLLSELTRPSREDIISVLGVAEDRIGVEILTRGTSAEGVETEGHFYSVRTVRGGKVVRLEVFPSNARDDALRRFAELGPRPATRLDNDCVRLMRREWDLYDQQDWEGIRGLYAADANREDRRPSLRATHEGAEAVVENLQALWSVGGRRVSFVPAAVRGQRLALFRFTVGSDDPEAPGFVTEVLSLASLNAYGRFSRSIAFEADAFDEALAELDDWYAADEGAPYAEELRALSKLPRVDADTDWDDWRDSLTSDFVFVDRSPASRGELDRDGWLESIKAMVGLTEDWRAHRPVFHALTREGAVSELVLRGTTNEGSAVEMVYQAVTLLRDGRWSRMEFFPVDQLDAAFARFEELTRAETPAEQAQRRVNECLVRRDWEGARALHRDDVTWEDRRPGLQMQIAGIDARLEHLKAGADVGIRRATAATIATRGERLVVSRVVAAYETDDSFESDMLFVYEVDETGLVAAGVVFDGDELPSALDELDRRFIQGEGRHAAAFLELWFRFTRLYASQDWDALTNVFAPDFVTVDHRPASAGARPGGAAFVSYVRELVEQMHDLHVYASEIAVLASDHGVFRTEVRGLNTFGGEVHVPLLVHARARGDRIARFDGFAADRLDDALASFAAGAEPASTEPDNPAMRALRSTLDTMAAEDWQSYGRLYAPDASWDDRRSVLAYAASGRDQIVEAAKAAMAFGADAYAFMPIATRGERLALAHVVHMGSEDDTFEVELLKLGELDNEGLLAAVVNLDADDLDAAFAELDDRYVAGEGSPYADVWNTQRSVLASERGQDWDAHAALHASDVKFVAHRPVSAGRLNYDEFVRLMQTYRELTPDIDSRAIHIDAIAADRVLYMIRAVGHTREGAQIEHLVYNVSRVSDGRVDLLQAFAEYQLAEARARFDELGSQPVLENACVRGARRFAQLFAQDDWTEMARLMSSDDYLFEDRRRGFQTIIRDGAEGLENLRALKAVGVDELPFTAVAIRGGRLALCRYVLHGRDPDSSFGAETLVVNEVGKDGEMLSGIVFEPEDLDAAFDELEECYIAGEGRPYAVPLRLDAEIARSYNQRDWTTFRNQLREDVVLVDHRTAGAGTIEGAEELLRYTEGFVELAPDARLDVTEVLAIAADRIVARVMIHGATEDGAAVERPHFAVLFVRDDQLGRYEQFSIEDREAALLRFAELGAVRPQTTPPENAAVRAVRRLAKAQKDQDMDILGRVLGADSVWEDRRPALRAVYRGPDHLSNARAIYDVGTRRYEFTVIAVRGERLTLVRFVFAGEGATFFETEVLMVFELHADGVQLSETMFEPDDLDAAFAELDERYADGEGSAYRDPVLAQSKLSLAINERRWDVFDTLLDPYLVVHDHRPASLGEIAAGDWPAAMAALADVVANYRSEQQFFRALAHDRWWLQLHNRGETEDGGEVEFSFQSVGQVRNGRIVRLEIFPDSKSDDASALFGSLGRAAG